MNNETYVSDEINDLFGIQSEFWIENTSKDTDTLSIDQIKETFFKDYHIKSIGFSEAIFGMFNVVKVVLNEIIDLDEIVGKLEKLGKREFPMDYQERWLIKVTDHTDMYFVHGFPDGLKLDDIKKEWVDITLGAYGTSGFYSTSGTSGMSGMSGTTGPIGPIGLSGVQPKIREKKRAYKQSKGSMSIKGRVDPSKKGIKKIRSKVMA